MTVKIDLTPSLREMLSDKALAIGLPLERFIEDLLKHEVGISTPARNNPPLLSGAEKALAFGQWAKSFPADLPVLTLEGVSRENLYRSD